MREQGSMSESVTGRVQACSTELLQAILPRHLKVLRAVLDTSRCGTRTLYCSREHALNCFSLKQGQCCMACALKSRCCQEEDTVTDCCVLVIHTTRLSVNGANQWLHLTLPPAVSRHLAVHAYSWQSIVGSSISMTPGLSGIASTCQV